jgi:hypothetical protein
MVRKAVATPSDRSVVLVRAVAADLSVPGLQAMFGDEGAPPDDADLERLRAHIAKLFKDRWAVGPARVGVAVLPWIQEDGDPVSWRRVLRLRA